MTSSLSPLGKEKFFFTSESVTEGHPDKVADFVSDSILDACLAQDPYSRVACETLLTCNWVVVAGEITTNANVNWPEVIRGAIRKIGYTDAKAGLDADTAGVTVAINRQSPDIAMGVDTGGAGDQGMMFGYATDETDDLMPTPILLAHRLTKRLADLRRSGEIPWLRPDGKSQVTVAYEGETPVMVDTVVISTQHDDRVTQAEIRDTIIQGIIEPVIPEELRKRNPTYHVNPTGRFVTGGPQGDAGLTGRKIIVDTYGGMGRHGGGAFSGKDPTKVDRSACYAARWVAKNIVAAKLAKRCEVQLAYAIGVAEPVSIMVDTFGTGAVPDETIMCAVREAFDLRPLSIIAALDLRKPIYTATSAYGHFGREPRTTTESGNTMTHFSWELTNKVDDLVKGIRH